MSELYEVLFNLRDDGNGNLIGVPDSSNTNSFWDTRTFRFNKGQKMRKKDPHVIKFTLVNDETGRGLHFPSDRHEAMWVMKGNHCPNRDSDHDYSVIEPLIVIDEGRTLLALNTNPKSQKWGFTLNFLPAGVTDPTQSIPWDPVGDNQNSGKPLVSSYAAIAVGTSGFAAFAAYGFGLFGETNLAPIMEYVAVAVGTLCFAAFTAYLSGLFDR